MIYQFDEYRVAAGTFELWRDEVRLDIEPQVFELLLFLIENRTGIVTRDDLFERIWTGKVVSDATLSSRIKTLRKVLGDDGRTQKYIRTIHGRGFRFVGDVRQLSTDNPQHPGGRSPAGQPHTKYAKSGDVHVAYQLFGDGPHELVLAPGFVSHIENYWDEPNFAAWLNHLGSFARVVMFDKRGTGLSDRVSNLPGLDERMDDVRAVMDAVGFEEASVMGISEGGSLASVFAASHPARVRRLILYGAFAKFTSWFPTKQSLQGLFDYIESSWGSGESLPSFAPSMAENPAYKVWWGKFERLGANPGAAIALMRMNSRIDTSSVLSSISVPTLVIHRSEDTLIDVEGGRFLAEHLPNARYVELPGRDHLPWVGSNAKEILEVVKKFLEETRQPSATNGFLATILCLRFPGCDQGLPEECLNVVRNKLQLFGGREVNAPSVFYVACFSGPARAIHCALEITMALEAQGTPVRVGVHTGEVELQQNEVVGVGVDIASKISNFAEDDEVIVSRTVRDLVAGSGIQFRERGLCDVGLSEAWSVYRVT